MGTKAKWQSAVYRGAARAVSCGGQRGRFLCRVLPLAVISALGIAASPVLAGPIGGQVVAGSAAIRQTTAQRTDVVQSSQRAVINWRDFSIGAAEQVNFQQPSAQAAVLNRVTGSDVSNLLGRLTANGQVYLVNPNGIFIGPGARIDAASFLATTTNIATDDFMHERLRFDDVANRQGVIVNQGEITVADGGLVALVAPGVENSGVIRARLGKVVLASGNKFTLDLYGDELISLAVDDAVIEQLRDAQGRPLKARVSQAGRIEADGGEVHLTASTARSVLDDAINMSGQIRAASVAQEAGDIVLRGPDDGVVSVSGTLDAAGMAPGQRGGRITVTGGDVRLAGTAVVDASGDARGGQVRVGGDYQGKGSLPRARKTQVAAGATLRADAKTTGDGGSVVVWSDGATTYAGSASARGGALGGDGGLIEVSGKQGLVFRGTADAAAPAGQAGRLLLDPTYQVVDEVLALSIGDILGAGTNVNLQADLDITVQAMINGLVEGGTAGAALSLTAGRDLLINSDVLTDNGPIMLVAGRDILMSAVGGVPTYLYANASPITLAAGGNVTAQHLLTSGAVSVTSTGGSVALLRSLAYVAGTGGIGDLTVRAPGEVTVRGVRSTGGIDVRSTSADVELRGPLAGAAVTIQAATDLSLVSDVQSRGAISLRAVRGMIEIGDDVLVASSAGDIRLTAGSGGIRMEQGSVLRASSHDITLRAGGPVTVRHLETTGTVTIGTPESPIGGAVTLLEDIGALSKDSYGSALDIPYLIDLTASPAEVSIRAASVRLEGGVAARDRLSIVSTSGNVEAVNPVWTEPDGTVVADTNLLVAGGSLRISSASNATLSQELILTGQGETQAGVEAPVLIESGGALQLQQLTSNTGAVLLRSTSGDVSVGTVSAVGTAASSVAVTGAGIHVGGIDADGAVALSGRSVVVGSGGITAGGNVDIIGETTLAGDVTTRQHAITIRSEVDGVLKPLRIDLLTSPIELRFWASGFSDPGALAAAGVVAALPGGVAQPGNMYYDDANAVFTEALPRFQQWYAMLGQEWLDSSQLHVSLSRGRTLSTFAGRTDFSAADPGSAITIEAASVLMQTRSTQETLAPEVNGVLNLVADHVALQGPASAITSPAGDPVTVAVRRAQADSGGATLTLESATAALAVDRVTLSQESAGGINVVFDSHLGNGLVSEAYPAGWVSGALAVTGVGGLSEAQLAAKLGGAPPGVPYFTAKESGGQLGPPPRSFTSDLSGSGSSVSGVSFSAARRVSSRSTSTGIGETGTAQSVVLASAGPSAASASIGPFQVFTADLVTDSWFDHEEPGWDAYNDWREVGGPGLAAKADLGQESAAEGPAADIFSSGHHVARGPSGDNPYFGTDPFGIGKEAAEEEDEAN